MKLVEELVMIRFALILFFFFFSKNNMRSIIPELMLLMCWL